MKDKPLYIISIVSELLELHPQTLRQYERLGLVKPSRTIGNTRLYSDEDIDRLRFIVTLTKDMGVNLAGVEVIMNMREQIEHLQGQLEQALGFIHKHVGPDGRLKNETSITPAPPRNIIKVKIERE